MDICTEIRLMVYKEAFSQSHVTGHPRGLESAMNDPITSRTMSSVDDSNDLDDCDGPPARLSLKGKLGLPLVCKAIYTEALPILYETHRFKLTVWEETQDNPEARKPAGDMFQYTYYFLRRNSVLVEHMTHVEILFELKYDHCDKHYAGAHDLTISLLQDIAAACPSLETFRSLAAMFPRGWILNDDDPRSNVRRDTAIACFRDFVQQDRNLEFQLITHDKLDMLEFFHEIAPLGPEIWTTEHSRDIPPKWRITDPDHEFGYPPCDLHRLSASSYLRIMEGLSSAEDPAKKHSSMTTI